MFATLLGQESAAATGVREESPVRVELIPATGTAQAQAAGDITRGHRAECQARRTLQHNFILLGNWTGLVRLQEVEIRPDFSVQRHLTAFGAFLPREQINVGIEKKAP